MTIKNLLIEALKDQQEIFGNDLLENIQVNVATPESKSPQTANEREPGIKINLFETTKEKPVQSKPVIKIDGEFNKTSTLEELNSAISECMNCNLGETRKNFVFGVGNPSATAMLIGEAPGADEDEQGEPFVGRAGILLNDIIKAIKFKREEIYIANILKCRPPGNRNPSSSEMITCMPYLFKQIELINPKIILCLGKVAANGLLNNNESLSKMRGQVFDFNNRKLMVTYHPAALLRNPNWKRGCWEDVQKFRKLHDELVTG
ncbi:MAG: uracil-DNA glycosylase family protein [Rhodothermaceae bacterium]